MSRYLSALVNITYEDTLKIKSHKSYNLNESFSKLTMKKDIPSKDSFIKQISFLFQKQFYILTDKNEQNMFYSDIYNTIDICFDFITNCKLTKNLAFIEYDNKDRQFDQLDKFLNWMMESDFSSLTEFIFNTSQNLSNQQFTLFYKLITQKLKQFTSLQTDFQFFGELQEREKSFIQNSLIIFNCYNISSKEQLFCLRQSTKLQQLDINFYNQNLLNIDSILEEIKIIQQSLTCLKLQFCQLQKINKNSLKILEKLTQLTELHIYCDYTLSKDYLDINKFKNLKTFILNCQEPFLYLDQIGNNERLEKIQIINRKNKNNPKIKLGKFKCLISFQSIFQCQNKVDLEQLKNELKEIKKIGNQLKVLKLDFSNCIYFQNQFMDDQIIELLGQIFQKCTEEANIHLVIENCRFTYQQSLELSLQFQLIPNIGLFQLNQNKKVEEITSNMNDSNVISFIDFGIQDPYNYGIISNYSKFFDKILIINFNECFYDFFNENLDDLKKYITFFKNFKKFDIQYDVLIKFSLKQQHDRYEIYMLNILPKNLSYLSINYLISLKSIINLIENFKKLQVFECKLRDIWFTPFDQEILSIQSQRNISLNLGVFFLFSQFDQVFNLFYIKGYFVKITIHLPSQYNIKIIQSIFDLINQYQWRILVYFEKVFQQQYPYYLINNYSQDIMIERLKLVGYSKQIKWYMKFNLRMIYCDLYFD